MRVCQHQLSFLLILAAIFHSNSLFACRTAFLALFDCFLYSKYAVSVYHHDSSIGVKFCVAKQTHVPLGRAKFHMNRCSDSPLRGENADFWPVSKFNTGSLPLRGILLVITIT